MAVTNTKNPCKRSYSQEHAGTPITKNYWKCNHCFKIYLMAVPNKNYPEDNEICQKRLNLDSKLKEGDL